MGCRRTTQATAFVETLLFEYSGENFVVSTEQLCKFSFEIMENTQKLLIFWTSGAIFQKVTLLINMNF